MADIDSKREIAKIRRAYPPDLRHGPEAAAAIDMNIVLARLDEAERAAVGLGQQVNRFVARLDEAEREVRKLDRALRVVLEEYGWSPGAIDIYIRGLEDASDSPA